MTFRSFSALALTLFLTTGSLLTAADRPNIVLVLADDLGWADLGCQGGDLVETPHIDQLARDGLRFTQAYAPAAICTPTRAALMTGKSPARLHMTVWSEDSLRRETSRKLLPAESRHDLPRSEITIAERLTTQATSPPPLENGISATRITLRKRRDSTSTSAATTGEHPEPSSFPTAKRGGSAPNSATSPTSSSASPASTSPTA